MLSSHRQDQKWFIIKMLDCFIRLGGSEWINRVTGEGLTILNYFHRRYQLITFSSEYNFNNSRVANRSVLYRIVQHFEFLHNTHNYSLVNRYLFGGAQACFKIINLATLNNSEYHNDSYKLLTPSCIRWWEVMIIDGHHMSRGKSAGISLITHITSTILKIISITWKHIISNAHHRRDSRDT